MFLELHLIQNFAPSNLNRDDTNAPKDCDFGGFRRARISSQCLKRAIRETFKNALTNLIPANNLALRTRQLVDETVRQLQAQGKAPEKARPIIEMVLESIKLKVKDDGKTEYLLFLGKDEINRIVSLCLENWDTLAKLIPSEETAKTETTSKKGKGKSDKEAKEPLPKEISNAMLNLMDGGKAVDLGLFGRMLANLPEKNIDAACQVAHAISTHKVNTEFDFFTAIDDIVTNSDDQGAGMLGTVEFNSACFYRYANVDLNQLKHNLGDDEELTLKAAQAFVQASVKAIPTGKQNSMAAQNLPSFVLVVLRKSGLWSLANAFIKPIRPKQDLDLVTSSIEALTEHWSKLSKTYGEDEIVGKWLISLDDTKNISNTTLANAQVDNLASLTQQMIEQLKPSNGGQ